MEDLVVLLTPANLSTAGSSEDVTTLPADFSGKLVSAQYFLDTANCDGVGAALTLRLQTGADTAESTLYTVTLHNTNDQQEGTVTLTKSAAGQNFAGSTRIRALLTSAGADHAVATGCRLRLFFRRPIMPA